MDSMTMMEYEKHIEAMTEGMKALSPGTCTGCDECPEYDEGHFSWSSCDVCGSTAGGDRYAAHYLDEDDEIMHIEICQDCVLFLANGDTPDYVKGPNE